MRKPLAERARGRWRNLLPLVGVDSRFLSGKQGPCPMCDGKTRFRFDDLEGRGTWICNACGAGDGAELAMRVLGLDFRALAKRIDPLLGEAAQRPVKPTRSQDDCRRSMNDLWRTSHAVTCDDPVGRYLFRRVGLTNVPACLRCADRLRYQDDVVSYHPAMIAMVMGHDGIPATLHRTYLAPGGTKADVEVPRRLMPGTIPDGAAIRLFDPAPVLGIAEGIETAFAAASLFGVPCWAAVSSTMLAKWIPPEDVREIIVFGDSDQKFAGQASAYSLAHRLAMKGWPVRVELPALAGADWNDVLLRKADFPRGLIAR
ncbi:toprim domain-containing protein [Methylobacterium sp. E-045]|uniref:toprim domain-containing protein n=1 Tax=Methylobacterium sp. E-045 TaxID=2836575 RepID=UPI001FB87D44|nr:toprim domain-containing protein [Methylobacterium sp. E-045]MCJ2131480.1 toprim domain-containing protein [Methylobacterium sp. E-045]